MKKLVVGLLASVLMAAGLVGVAPAPHAAAACPYTGCFNTTTTLKGPTPRAVHPNQRDRATFVVNTRGRGTSLRPQGFFFVRVKGRAKLNNRYVRFTMMIKVPPSGPTVFRLRKLPLGSYRIAVRYYPNASSPFSTSISGVKNFRVTKLKR